MDPIITNFREVNTLNAALQPVRGLQVTYYVGKLGPFTEMTSWQAVQDGTLTILLRQKAAAVTALPGAQS